MAKLLPGFGGAPQVPPPPPPLPTREDPSIAEARERLRLAERRRAGRRATILTGPQSGLGATGVARPATGASQRLGE